MPCYHVYPKYWDILILCHTCPKIWTSPFLLHVAVPKNCWMGRWQTVQTEQAPHSVAPDLVLHCLLRSISPRNQAYLGILHDYIAPDKKVCILLFLFIHQNILWILFRSTSLRCLQCITTTYIVLKIKISILFLKKKKILISKYMHTVHLSSRIW